MNSSATNARKRQLTVIVMVFVGLSLYQSEMLTFAPSKQLASTAGNDPALEEHAAQSAAKLNLNRLGSPGAKKGELVTTAHGRWLANEPFMKRPYLLCDSASKEPLRVVFGILAGPQYIQKRVAPSLMTWLKDEISVIYLEGDKHDKKVQASIKKHIEDNPVLRNVNTTLVFLEKPELESKIGSLTGSFKNLMILEDLYNRFEGALSGGKSPDWYITADDDSFVIGHNLRIHLSTYYSSVERKQQCRGWEAYKNYWQEVNATMLDPNSNVLWTPSGEEVKKNVGDNGLPHLANLHPDTPVYMGVRIYLDKHPKEEKLDAMGVNYMIEDVYLVHGGGGIYTNRAALRYLLERRKKENESATSTRSSHLQMCFEQCQQQVAGDLRVGCCMRKVGISVTNDNHFTIMPFLRMMHYSTRTDTIQRRAGLHTGSYHISFHGSRVNASLPLDMQEAIDWNLDIGKSCPTTATLPISAYTSRFGPNATNALVPADNITKKNTYVSKRCTNKALRGVDAPQPIYFDSLKHYFLVLPLAEKYPQSKWFEWGTSKLPGVKTDDDPIDT